MASGTGRGPRMQPCAYRRVMCGTLPPALDYDGRLETTLHTSLEPRLSCPLCAQELRRARLAIVSDALEGVLFTSVPVWPDRLGD